MVQINDAFCRDILLREQVEQRASLPVLTNRYS